MFKQETRNKLFKDQLYQKLSIYQKKFGKSIMKEKIMNLSSRLQTQYVCIYNQSHISFISIDLQNYQRQVLLQVQLFGSSCYRRNNCQIINSSWCLHISGDQNCFGILVHIYMPYPDQNYEVPISLPLIYRQVKHVIDYGNSIWYFNVQQLFIKYSKGNLTKKDIVKTNPNYQDNQLLLINNILLGFYKNNVVKSESSIYLRVDKKSLEFESVDVYLLESDMTEQKKSSHLNHFKTQQK